MKPQTQLTLLAGIVTLGLSACSHTEPGIRVETVYVPTAVPCIPADQIPAEPPLVGHLLNGDPAHDIAIVAPSALLLRLWGKEMAAALTACAGGAE